MWAASCWFAEETAPPAGTSHKDRRPRVCPSTASSPERPQRTCTAGSALIDAQCAALFDFDGQDDDELSFKAGDILIITGELNGWFLGRCRDGGEKVGIFPSNFVQMNK